MASGSLQFQEPTHPPQGRCAFCLQPAENPTRFLCPKCRAVYHAECWKANDSRCAVYGCHRPAPPPRPPQQPVPSRGRGVPGWIGLVGAAVLIILASMAKAPHSPTTELLPRVMTTERLERIRKAVDLCTRGLEKQKNGDLHGALGNYTKAIELENETPIPFHNRAVVKVLLGDLNGAHADYTRAIELDPRYGSAWCGRGYVRDLGRNYKGAIDDCTKAIEINPLDARAYQIRGGARLAESDSGGAVSDYTNEIELGRRGRGAAAYANRGMARWSGGDLSGAMNDVNQAISLNPALAGPYHDRGHLRTDMEDLEGAIADFARAFELDPSKPEPLFDRACREYELRDWTRSLEDFERAFMIHRDARDHARIRIFLIHARLGNRMAAQEELIRYLYDRNRRGSDPWSLDLLRFVGGRLTERALLEAVVSTEDMDARSRRCEAYFLAGMLRLLMGDRATAGSYFTESVRCGSPTKSEHSSAAAELRYLSIDD